MKGMISTSQLSWNKNSNKKEYRQIDKPLQEFLVYINIYFILTRTVFSKDLLDHLLKMCAGILSGTCKVHNLIGR